MELTRCSAREGGSKEEKGERACLTSRSDQRKESGPLSPSSYREKLAALYPLGLASARKKKLKVIKRKKKRKKLPWLETRKGGRLSSSLLRPEKGDRVRVEQL